MMLHYCHSLEELDSRGHSRIIYAIIATTVWSSGFTKGIVNASGSMQRS